MADNSTLNSGTGGDTYRSVDKTGVKTQVVTLDVGGSGAESLVGGTVPVSGTVTVTGTVGVTQHTILGTGTLSTQVTNTVAVGQHTILGTGTFSTQVTSIAAGDNNIGNVDIVTLPALAAGTNNIGDVDVLSIIPGTGATNLGKAIGSSAGATDTGVAPLALRDDTLSSLADPEGDYVPLRVSSTGALHVTGAGGGTQYNTNDAATVVATGTLAIAERDDSLATLSQADGDWAHLRVNSSGALWVAPVAGSAEFVDDSTFVAGSSTIVMTGAVFDDSTPDSVNEGDAGALRMSSRREMYVQIRDAAGNERGLRVDANGAIAVTGTFTSSQSTVVGTGTFPVQVTSIAAGDNNIGNVDIVTLPALAAGTNNIGDVDVLSIIPGTGATNLGKAVGDAAGGTDTGTVPLAIRDDTLSSLADAEGDYVPLRVSSTGALHVTGAGGGTQYNTNGAATTLATGTLAIVERDDALTSLSQADGEWAHLRVDSTGAQWVHVTSIDSGISISQHTVLSTGTFQTQVSNTVAVGQHTVLGSGTFSVQVTSCSQHTVTGSGSFTVVGAEAHAATALSNPVMNAGVSQNVINTPVPTNRVSSAGMVTKMAVDRDGALFVRPHPPQCWNYHIDTSTAQTDATVANAAGAGLSHYIGTIAFSSGAATAINLLVSEGNTTTVCGPYYLEAVAGRGMCVQFNPPRKLTANMSVCITTSASIAHSVDMTGFTAP